MILYPAIDLKDGECVRLVKGEMAAATVFSDNPAAQATFVLLIVGVLLTAFYTFRMVIMTFHGDARDKELHESAHESPAVMIVPLVILALLAAGAGAVLGFPPEEGMVHEFMRNVPGTAHFEFSGAQTIVISLAVISTAVALLGALSAYMIYSRRRPRAESIGRMVPGLHTLLYRKYYVDELVNGTVIRLTHLCATVLRWFDEHIIDGIVLGVGRGNRAMGFLQAWFDRTVVDGLVNGAGALTQLFGSFARLLQTGRIQQYVTFAVGGGLIAAACLILA